MDDLPKVITIQEAAKVLLISKNGAYAAARAGRIPTVKIGRRYLVPVKALAEMLEVKSKVVA